MHIPPLQNLAKYIDFVKQNGDLSLGAFLMEVANFRNLSPEFRVESAKQIMETFLQPSPPELSQPTTEPTLTHKVSVSAEFLATFSSALYMNPAEARNAINMVGAPIERVLAKIRRVISSDSSIQPAGGISQSAAPHNIASMRALLGNEMCSITILIRI
jgi:hypothetical protein